MTGSVDKPSASWLAKIPGLRLTAALCGGTEAMRKAGQEYLPREEKESDPAYTTRLGMSTLFPAYRRTVDMFVSMPLQKQIQISEDTPDDIFEWLQNVDLTGRDLDTFARTVFRAAINDGVTHILVDYPEVAAVSKQTLADERAAKRRPYAIHVLDANILGYKSDLVNGAHRLTQVRISELSEEPDPADEFAEIVVQRVRVLERGRVRVFRKDSATWTLEKDSRVSMTEIPLITLYTDRQDFMRAKPPLLDLAFMNVAHWQSTSDQRTILHVARVPLLHIATDADDADIANLTIGASRAITTPVDTIIKFVEHSGAAIAAGQEDLNALKAEMSNYGLELLTSPGRVTATERVIDKNQSDSAVSVMARELKNALTAMVRTMADWVGLPPDAELGDVDLQTEFKFEVNPQEATLLWNMRINGDISQESFWMEMQRRGVLSETFDPEEETVKLESELPVLPEPALDPTTGLPVQPPDPSAPPVVVPKKDGQNV